MDSNISSSNHFLYRLANDKNLVVTKAIKLIDLNNIIQSSKFSLNELGYGQGRMVAFSKDPH